jgi:hypothetical protein
VERELLDIARRQHGLFTTQQALDAGFSRMQIHDRTECGRWTLVARGIRHLAGSPFTWATNVMCACLATGGVASHRSAALLLGVVDARPGRPEVTVGRNRRVRVDGIAVHRSTDLIPGHVTTINGIPTTTPVRLAMDLGAVVAFPTYERAIDDLIARRKLNWDEMLEALGALSRQGRNGRGPARALLLERYDDDVPDSMLERAFLALVRGAGLPEPAAQVELSDTAGFIARVDFAYPAVMVAIELDGRRHHLHADAFERDRAKWNRLQLLGWQVLAYTWEQVIRSGPTIVRQLSRVLGI